MARTTAVGNAPSTDSQVNRTGNAVTCRKATADPTPANSLRQLRTSDCDAGSIR
jgi:hypothetical protein